MSRMCTTPPCTRRVVYVRPQYTEFVKEMVSEVTFVGKDGKRQWRYYWPGSQHLTTSEMRLAALRSDLNKLDFQGDTAKERAGNVFKAWCALQAGQREHEALRAVAAEGGTEVPTNDDDDVGDFEIEPCEDWDALDKEITQLRSIKTDPATKLSLSGLQASLQMLPSASKLHRFVRDTLDPPDWKETRSGASVEIDELVCFFRCLDVDGDGEISSDDFVNAIAHKMPSAWYPDAGAKADKALKKGAATVMKMNKLKAGAGAKKKGDSDRRSD